MNPSFIVDCSYAMTWCFRDEATPATTDLLRRLSTDAALVPGLWFLEVSNVLALAEKKKRIKPVQTAEFIAMLRTLDLQVDDAASARSFNEVLPLCRAHDLTSYDAVYLELATRRRLPLATLDEQRTRAAKKLGVKIIGS